VLDLTHAATVLLQAGPQAGLHAALQTGHTLADTLVTKTVTTEPGIFTKITTVASGLMTIALLVLAVALTPAAWSFRKTYRKVNHLLDRVYGDVQPLVRSASLVAEDAREVMTIVKGDVRQVQQTVAAANDRLVRAVRETERRIEDFNALLEVVQDEAEETFVRTASAVRGVRTGLGQVLDSRDREEEEYDDGYHTDGPGHARGAVGGPARADESAAAGRPRIRPHRADEPA